MPTNACGGFRTRVVVPSRDLVQQLKQEKTLLLMLVKAMAADYLRDVGHDRSGTIARAHAVLAEVDR